MKRILLSLLAYGMFVSVSAQPEISKKTTGEVSDKWVITPIPTMKGVLGRLDINFPADVDRDILIYRPADNKFLTSVSHNDKTYNIAPGVYRFTLTAVPVENVPIQQGHETRIKMGFLNVVSEGWWHLYNETKEKNYINSSKPYKVALPVGRYQIKLGGQFYPVIIKDGETVEDYSSVEVKDEIPGNEKLKNIGTNPQIAHTNNPYWVITPLQAMTDGIGKLSIIIPKDTTIYLIDKWITIPYNIRDTIRINETGNTSSSYYTIINLPKYLTVRSYSISLNGVRFTVPVESGKETRVKAGFLIITKKEAPEGSGPLDNYFDTVFGENDGVNWEWKLTGWGIAFTGKKRTIFALPPGEYSLTKFDPSDGGPGGDDIHYRVIIKDGEWVKNGVRLNSSGNSATSNATTGNVNATDKWLITPVPTMKGVLGRLDINFPADVDRDILIYRPADNKFLTSVSDNDKTYTIAPGQYRFTLTNVPVDNVPIQKGHETRLKAGFLNIVSEGKWYLYDETKEKAYKSGNKPKKLPLPIGSYQLKLGLDFYPFVIKDGETVEY